MICTIKILDQVNVKLEGLTPSLLAQCKNALKFFIPSARHTPAFKLGRWDGTKAFMTGNRTYLNLLDRILPIIIDNGYEIEIDDHRPPFAIKPVKINANYLADQGIVWGKGHPAEGQPILLRDHQIDAINMFIDNPQSISQLSTSAGKTLICLVLSLIYQNEYEKFCETKGRSLIIVPNKSLVLQTEKDYIDAGQDVGVIFQERRQFDKLHTITTWQSLDIVLEKKEGHFTQNAETLLRDQILVITDEAHTARGSILQNLLSRQLANIPVRLGISGSLPKPEYEYLSLVSTMGPEVGGVKAKELIDKGILSTLNVNMIELDDSHVEFVDYHEEARFLSTDQKRLNWFADFCLAKAKSGGNTMVLINNIETGKYLAERCGTSSVYICGEVDVDDRAIEYAKFHSENNLLLFASFKTSAVGINITKLYQLIMYNATKNEITILQTIGRLLRKGGDKHHAELFDVYSNLKFAKKHAKERKKIYKEAEHPVTVKKIKYR